MSKNYNRIISLVPSLTELLIDLGLTGQLIGRTRFCVHPEDIVKKIAIIGGTKNPRIDKISALNPDFIIANKEENRSADIQKLQNQTEARIEITDIGTIEDALLAIRQLGAQLGVSQEAATIMQKISSRLDRRPDEHPLRTVYFIWRDPWMTIGGDTYIHDVLGHWNLQNIFGHRNRYPKINLEKLTQHNPELILLSSEPYPFREKHIHKVREACPNTHILLVNGEWFSWYGSRMEYAFEQLNVWRRAIS